MSIHSINLGWSPGGAVEPHPAHRAPPLKNIHTRTQINNQTSKQTNNFDNQRNTQTSQHCLCPFLCTVHLQSPRHIYVVFLVHMYVLAGPRGLVFTPLNTRCSQTIAFLADRAYQSASLSVCSLLVLCHAKRTLSAGLQPG